MLRLNAADPALGPTVSHSSLVAEAIQNRRNRAVGTGLSQLPYQLSPGDTIPDGLRNRASI